MTFLGVGMAKIISRTAKCIEIAGKIEENGNIPLSSHVHLNFMLKDEYINFVILVLVFISSQQSLWQSGCCLVLQKSHSIQYWLQKT